MATFTFRIPDSIVGRLSSAELRSWLTDFQRNPHSLPNDPGSGYERISLTLPGELVQTAAAYLRCSPSVALRRLALARLGPRQTMTAVSQTGARPGAFPVATQGPWRPVQPLNRGVASKSSTLSRQEELRVVVAQFIAGLLTFSIVVLAVHVSSKVKKRT